jgi:anaerobic magnesium-protoporphyrin IX monomethyl ester cyclase
MHTGKVRVALIYPPSKINRLFYSLAYLSNHIRKLGKKVDVKVINCPALGYFKDDLIKALEEFQPHIIGISIPFTIMLPSSMEVMRDCRKKFLGSLLIAGGAHATICPEDLFDKCDFVVVGDGEHVLTKMIESFPRKEDIENLDGIAFSKNGKMILRPQDPRHRIMGSPDWENEELSQHLYSLIYGTKEKAAAIFTSKGCVYNCSYCSNNLISGHKIVYRKIEDVIKEIRFYIDRYKIKSFDLLDEIFTVNEKRVIEFCDAIEKEKLNITWGFQTRANLVSNKSLLKRMRAAGARVISLGIESGNEDVLRANKGLGREAIIEAVNILKEAGFIIYAGFIIGFPQDTIETVWQTICFPDELGIDSPGFQIMVPYPKTEVRRIAEKEGGILTDDFEQYSTYDVVYSPPGLAGYDLLAIRQFAHQYFHTRNEHRLNKWLSRFEGHKNFEEISKVNRKMFMSRDSINLDYLKEFKLSNKKRHRVNVESLPVAF